MLGLGTSWGSRAASGLRDQYTMELFCRLQLSWSLVLTPSVQLLINPAVNPERDSVWVLGIRARLAL